MICIKHMEKIMNIISDFKFSDLNRIIHFSYYVDQFDYDNTSNIEACFMLKNYLQEFKVCIKFYNVSKFKLDEVSKVICISGFDIESMKERGWDRSQKYHVFDYENDTIEFFCESIEVVSVE